MHYTCANTADVQRFLFFFGDMQGFLLMLMVLLLSSVPQSAHSTVALKRAPSPPAFRATSPPPPPSHHPDIMDGFYDQQVPFLVPPSVSGHTAASDI